MFQHHNSSITLTPTRRLASQLMKTYGMEVLQTQKTWETPNIQSIGDWLQGLWDQLEIKGIVTRLLLTPSQALLQWEMIIRQSIRGKRLLKSYDTAKTAYRAWELLHQWRLYNDIRSHCDNSDHEAFADWAAQYHQWLIQNQFIDSALMMTIMADHISNLSLQSTKIVLYAFDSLTPQTEAFLACLRDEGVCIETQDPPLVTPKTCQRQSFHDSYLEMHACAQWAQAQMEAGKKEIAIIVPNLPDRRGELERILQETVDVGLGLSPVDPYCEWLNFSAAKPLIQYALIQDAMQTIMEGMSQKKYLSFERWGKYFEQILAQNNWPGERPLNSIEHQVVKRFFVVLEEFSQLQCMINTATLPELTDIDAHEAYRCLQNLLANIPFQPESKSPIIQVLGTLEASGLYFEAAWILGLHRDAWPEQHHPNPFISQKWQRQYQFPHACPDHEMAYAMQITHRLKHCAEDVIVSYPLTEQDRHLAESPLISDLPMTQCEVTPKRCEDIFIKAILESWEDNQGPYIEGNIRGGSQLLRFQAQCPFKAFAHTRLAAKMIEVENEWLAPYEKGMVLHEILEDFWHETPDQQQLLLLSSLQIEKKFNRLIEKILPKYIREDFSDLYISVEKERILEILKNYVELEKTRPSFAVIATEWSTEYCLDKLTLNIRIDRIDRDTKTDSIRVIDYKTGNFNFSRLWDERLEEVQLPLYYLALKQANQNPSALMTIQLDLKEISYNGIAQSSIENIEGLTESAIPWEALKAYWEEKMMTLAQEYRQGCASVAPYQGQITCQRCDLSAFCRIGLHDHVI